MSEWKEHKLGDLFEESNQGVNTTTEKVKYSDNGAPVIRAKNISQYNIDYNDIVFVDSLTFDRLKESVKPEKNNVLYTNIGSQLGSAALVKVDYKFLIAWNVFRIIPNKKKLNPIFLVYLLNNPKSKAFIENLSSSSTMPFVSGGVLRSLEFAVPSLHEQQAIASVLSSLDDKIDLLQRQNKTLEALAQTLFRHWFVDGAEEGWEEGELGELIKISSGKGLKRRKFVEDGPYSVLGANGEIGRAEDYLVDEKVIFTGRVGTLGNIFISSGKAWLSDNTLIIKPKSRKLFYFVYFLLKTAHLEDMNVGSTQPLIRQSDVKDIEISVPPSIVLEEFSVHAELLFAKIDSNQIQIRTLEKLRDTLLPKLMSGEVRVRF